MSKPGCPRSQPTAQLISKTYRSRCELAAVESVQVAWTVSLKCIQFCSLPYFRCTSHVHTNDRLKIALPISQIVANCSPKDEQKHYFGFSDQKTKDKGIVPLRRNRNSSSIIPFPYFILIFPSAQNFRLILSSDPCI